MSVTKELVAGAARSLWVNLVGPEDGLQEKLKYGFGAAIAYSEAMTRLGGNFFGVTPSGFAILCQFRWRIAEAAQYLFMVHGAEPGFLIGARPAQIDDAYAAARAATKRDSSVADAAQWLYMNRELVSYEKLSSWPSVVILRAAEACRGWDAQFDPSDYKNYSLSDLRRAYDMGFGNSGEGWNQEIHPDFLGKESYQAERNEALRSIK